MGEWVIGAFINLFGSIAINFGTNLLKLGHTERERSVLDSNGTNGKFVMKPIVHFQTWRVGLLFFAFGNCLNFISFGYAAQSLLAALGSVQFVSNIAFAHFVLSKRVSVKVLVATAFIVLGNIFLVAFGNHQSPVYTPDQLAEKYSSITFVLYCFILVIIVAVHHYIYRRGELLVAVPGHELNSYWHMLLPFSYAVVSGAVGSCSVLFAKSLSNLLRLAMSGGYQLHTLFTYSMLLLFLSTAGFWMARLNEGLALFDAILIVPMFQIAWTLFSICTGFVYFQEYQKKIENCVLTITTYKISLAAPRYRNIMTTTVVLLLALVLHLYLVSISHASASLYLTFVISVVFNTLRTTMFILGMMSVFIGISLLAPDDSKGGEVKDNSLDSITSSKISTEGDRLVMAPVESQSSVNNDSKPIMQTMLMKATDLMVKAKSACLMSLGLGEDSLNASSVFVMPMMSSKITGFRGNSLEKAKLSSMRNPGGFTRIPVNEEGAKLLETSAMLSAQAHL